MDDRLDLDPLPRAGKPGRWQRHTQRLGHRASQLDPTVKGLLWASAAGLLFTILTGLMRALSLQLDPFQTQFLRYLFGMLVLLPLVWHRGFAAYRPKAVGGQFARGAVHTVGMGLMFVALPEISLAETTAIGFTLPIFIMLGAYFVFREAMRWERWLAAGIGFAGVLIVVVPQLQGGGSGGFYSLMMLASAPVFAASFLITKALTRYESAGTILLWQAITVTFFSLPLAVLNWSAPTLLQWAGFLLCGGLGSGGHYCLTRSFHIADISATQSVKFLELVWAAGLGWLMFADVPLPSTLVGGGVICASTLWIARRESRSAAPAR